MVPAAAPTHDRDQPWGCLDQGCTKWGQALEPLGHRGVKVWGCPGRGQGQLLPRSVPLRSGNPARRTPARRGGKTRPGSAGKERDSTRGYPASSGPGSRRRSEGLGAGGGCRGPAVPGSAPCSVPGFPRSRPRSFIHRSRALPAHSSRRAGSSVTMATAPPLPTALPPRSRSAGGAGGRPGSVSVCVWGGSWPQEPGGLSPGSPRSSGCRRGGSRRLSPPEVRAAAATSAGAAPAPLPRAGAGARPRRFPSWAGLGAA